MNNTCDECYGSGCEVCNQLGWINRSSSKMSNTVDTNEANKDHKRCLGKIIHIEMPSTSAEGQNKGGYGFITSADIPLTRIFFHWTALAHNTTPFIELKKDMKVEFIAGKHFNKETGVYEGYRAIKVKVLPDEG